MKKSQVLLLIISCLSINAQDRNLNVTVYNDNLGVIRDVRNMKIGKGITSIQLKDVAQLIDPTSVHIKMDATVLEQNYKYDLANFSSILQKYLEKNISLVAKDGKVITGQLISASGDQLVIKKSDEGLILLPKTDDYQLNVDKLPDGLISVPTLVWTVDAEKNSNQEVEVSYMTSGMSWNAQYVAVLNENDTKMNFNSWVSVTNNSGTTFPDAKLQLVAGDVNRVQTRYDFIEKNGATIERAPNVAMRSFEEKSFFEYHIYDMQRTTTLSNNETKQISLFEATDVRINKKYRYLSNVYSYQSSNDKGKVSVVVEFENKKENQIGMPMPKGIVRLYKSDGKNLQFIGEDRIEHTPKDEKISLKVGDAFDVVVEDTKVEENKISDKVVESSWEIKIRNRKEENIEVDVEKFMGSGWKILESSYPIQKQSADKVNFKIPVKKGGESILSFKVRYSY